MAIIQCSQSHYYDNEKFAECPHCAAKKQGKSLAEDSVTVALEAEQIENYAAEYIRSSAPTDHISISTKKEEEKTIGIYDKAGMAGCTAGWLVCIKGEDYGRDFRLYAGFNRIGRSRDSDIVLKDAGVSREEHCSVVYEEKKNVFYIIPKAGNLTYIGEELLEQAKELTDGQVITLGETQLTFVPFCVEARKWAKST